MPEEVNDDIDLKEHLKNMIEGSPTNWTYAILWHCLFPPQVLKFESGYYSGTGKAKEVCIPGSCVTVTEEVTHAESECFFQISMAQTFRFNKDLPGQAFVGCSPVWVDATDRNASTSWWGERHKWGRWERTKWGHQFGIQTFLCIPLEGFRVLELASPKIIPYDPEWLKQMEPFISPIGTPIRPPDPEWLKPMEPFVSPIGTPIRPPDLNEIWFPEREYNEVQNRGNNNISKPSRGKEKISDSKCSWPLLTESSDRGTDNNISKPSRGKEKISDSKCSWPSLTESSDRGSDRTFSCSHDYSGPSEFIMYRFH